LETENIPEDVPVEDFESLRKRFNDFIAYVCGQANGRVGGSSDTFAEIRQEVAICLFNAQRSFDSSKSNGLSSDGFLRACIKRRAREVARTMAPIPLPRKQLREVINFVRHFKREYGRSPNGEDLLGVFPKMNAKRARALLHALDPESFISFDGDEEDGDWGDDSSRSPLEETSYDLEGLEANRDVMTAFRHRLNMLSPEHRMIIVHTFGLNGAEKLTDVEIARQIGGTSSNVRLVRAQILYLLHTGDWVSSDCVSPQYFYNRLPIRHTGGARSIKKSA